MRFEDYSSHGKCNVCGAETDVLVCGSAMGAMSFAYCKECYDCGAEPYGALLVCISTTGKYPDEINDQYVEICRNSLKRIGKTEQEFMHDIKKIQAEDVERGQ